MAVTSMSAERMEQCEKLAGMYFSGDTISFPDSGAITDEVARMTLDSFTSDHPSHSDREKVRHIVLGNNTQLTAEGAIHYTAHSLRQIFPKLETINLSGTEITDVEIINTLTNNGATSTSQGILFKVKVDTKPQPVPPNLKSHTRAFDCIVRESS